MPPFLFYICGGKFKARARSVRFDPMPDEDVFGFLTVLGTQFCIVLREEAGIAEPSGHDCSCALDAALGVPVTFAVLDTLRPEQFIPIANAFNRYFEATTVTPAHVATAVAATLRSWR